MYSVDTSEKSEKRVGEESCEKAKIMHQFCLTTKGMMNFIFDVFSLDFSYLW